MSWLVCLMVLRVSILSLARFVNYRRHRALVVCSDHCRTLRVETRRRCRQVDNHDNIYCHVISRYDSYHHLQMISWLQRISWLAKGKMASQRRWYEWGVTTLDQWPLTDKTWHKIAIKMTQSDRKWQRKGKWYGRKPTNMGIPHILLGEDKAD